MKNIILKTSSFILVLFQAIIMEAKTNPPQPNPNGRTNNGLPPPPPGMPLDTNLVFLIALAIVLGMYLIYKNSLNTKNPI